MKRIIKFRGKDLKTGEWLYGSLVFDCDKKPMIFVSGYSHTGLGFSGASYVDPDTVGQFTGLLDKNGKEIYEGDIIRYIGNFDGDEFFRVVKYDVASFEPLYSSFIMTAYDEESWILEVIPRIIGNIHDNPELMKGDEE